MLLVPPPVKSWEIWTERGAQEDAGAGKVIQRMGTCPPPSLPRHPNWAAMVKLCPQAFQASVRLPKKVETISFLPFLEERSCERVSLSQSNVLRFISVHVPGASAGSGSGVAPAPGLPTQCSKHLPSSLWRRCLRWAAWRLPGDASTGYHSIKAGSAHEPLLALTGDGLWGRRLCGRSSTKDIVVELITAVAFWGPDRRVWE